MISTATRFGPNPWTNGLRLAFANLVLAALCAGSFVGVLLVISWVNHLGHAHGGPYREIAFPYLWLLLLYAILCPIAWSRLARRLPDTGRARLVSAALGAAPLAALSVLGYLAAAGALVVHQLDPSQMAAGSFFVFAVLSTVVLMAALACFALFALIRRRV